MQHGAPTSACSMKFYGARLLYTILVDDGRPRCRNDYDETVVLHRAWVMSVKP